VVGRGAVMKALRKVYIDVNFPVNIVDLGLIYAVQLKGHDVYIRVTLMHSAKDGDVEQLVQNLKDQLQFVKGVRKVNVEVVWNPPWTRDRMSPELKKVFGSVAEKNKTT
jgi:metal-sulfur cluster biosynthetic enzyme